MHLPAICLAMALMASGCSASSVSPPAPTPALVDAPIGALLAEAERGNTEPLEALLATGTALNGLIDGGPTLLMLAAASGQTHVIGILLDRGADIDRRDERGATALMYGANAGQLAAVELLVARGADLGMRTRDGKSAQSIASERNHPDVERALRPR